MERQQECAIRALEALKRHGAEQAQAVCSIAEKEELNFEHGEPSLLRSTTDYSLGLKGIRAGRCGQLAVNQLDADGIEAAAGELRALSEAGSEDPAHGIAPKQPAGRFEHGPREPDLARMTERMREFLETVRARYPRVLLEGGHLDFTSHRTCLVNSNGVEFSSRQGAYSFSAMFTAKQGAKMSSFNYSGGSFGALDQPLIERFGFDELLRQTTEQLDTRPVPEKFEGELLITPHCLDAFLGPYLGFLGDGPLIQGTSVFRGKLGETIASSRLSVRSRPREADLSLQEFFDGDGFAAEDMDVIDQGVLRSYLLSLYGSNKTRLPRAPSSGSRLFVDAGQEPRDELLRGIRRGLLLCRFSGGRPSPNGDFAGVAKNSYYVENGEIRHAVSETMVSGNLLRMFHNISGVSRERLSFGTRVLPWMRTGGVMISGK